MIPKIVGTVIKAYIGGLICMVVFFFHWPTAAVLFVIFLVGTCVEANGKNDSP